MFVAHVYDIFHLGIPHIIRLSLLMSTNLNMPCVSLDELCNSTNSNKFKQWHLIHRVNGSNKKYALVSNKCSKKWNAEADPWWWTVNRYLLSLWHSKFSSAFLTIFGLAVNLTFWPKLLISLSLSLTAPKL